MFKLNYLAVFSLLTLICHFQTVAQSQEPLKINVIPPSPNSAALAKYIEFPVNEYTGVPQISLPLGAISSKGVNVPIALNYHAGGLKVEETASWVGLGWSLSAGGVITRTVRGLPDEVNDGYLLGYNYVKQKILDFKNGISADAENRILLNSSASGIYDTEPDLFSFNFMGKSGSIVFDVDGNAITIPYQKLKIVKSGNSIDITDEYGFKYSFGELETTESSDAGTLGAIPAFVSSWYLSSIVSPTGETAQFNYVTGLTYQNNIPVKSQYTLIETRVAFANCSAPNEGPIKVQKINTARLESITIGKNQIKFKALTKRIDLSSPSVEYRLDSVLYLYDNKVVKKQGFEYNVFGCNRLRLDEVKEYSITGTNNSLFKFQYNDPTGVPCITSTAQDHWGFYNSNTYGSLIPPGKTITLSGSYIYYAGADRTPNLQKTQTGILNKIIYPTGGFTQFTYELNDYGFFAKNSVLDNEKGALNVSVQATPLNQEESQEFVIDTTQDVTITYQINVSDDQLTYPSYNEYVSIVNVNTGVTRLIRATPGSNSEQLNLTSGNYRLTAYSENPITHTGAYLQYVGNTGNIIKTRPTAGLRVSSIKNHDGLNTANDIVKTYKYVMSAEPARSSGVVMGEPLYDYTYTLHTVDNSCTYYVRTSRSHLLGTTQGSHIGYREVSVESNNGAQSLYKFTSFFDYPDILTVGFPFPNVTSYDFARGKLLQKFDYKLISGVKTTVQETKNYFKVDAYNYKDLIGLKVGYVAINPALVHTSFKYAYYDHVSAWVHHDTTWTTTYDLNGLNPIVSTKVFKYDNPTHIQPTRVETWASDGTKETVLKNYPLDYASGTTFIDNMNSAHLVSYPIEEIKYKTNASNQSSIVSGLITTYKDGGKGLKDEVLILDNNAKVLSEQFKFSNKSQGIIPPNGVNNSFVPDGLFKSRIKHQYDNNLNLSDYQLTDGIKNSYLWDYSNQYPIAEVKNAVQTNIAYTSFEADGKGNLNFNTAKIVADATAPIGKRCYTLSSVATDYITKNGLTAGQTYVLSYWVKTGASLTISGATLGTPTTVRTLNGWTLYSRTISNATAINFYGTGFIDDIRIYPFDAQMTSYTYDPLVGMTSATDFKGQSVYYEYDSFGRLKYIKDADGNILKEHTYNYKQ